MSRYLEERRRLKLTGAKPEKKTRSQKEAAQQKKDLKNELSQWYDTQIEKCGDTCQNCGADLMRTFQFHPRAPIAHVLPKSTLKSIATHPDNVLFLCLDCHAKYDNANTDITQEMPKAHKLAKSKYKILKHFITPDEARHVPEWIK